MAKKILLEHRSLPILLTLFGISCHSRDYFLVYNLNKHLELSFAKMDDFHGHSFFYFRDDNDFNAYYLLGNRSQESVLLPELKQTDYLLLVEGPFKKLQKENLLKVIRNAQGVLTAFEIRFETIKNYDVMLNDLELHHMRINLEMKHKYSLSKQ